MKEILTLTLASNYDEGSIFYRDYLPLDMFREILKMSRLENNYEILEKIGEGSCTTVYRAKNKITDDIAVVKKYKIEKKENNDEYKILKKLKSTNIVQVFDLFSSGNGYCFVMEYMYLNLKQYMGALNIPIDPKLIQSYTYQIFRGIKYCHDWRVVHGNLKPSNLLIDKAGIIKITSFNSASTSVRSSRGINIGTVHYRAPELFLGRLTYETASDIWSIGCIFAEMHTRQRLFNPKEGNLGYEMLIRIFKLIGTPEELQLTFPFYKPTLSRVVKPDSKDIDLLTQCLKYPPNKRITAGDASEHPYFDDMSKEVKDYFY